MLEVFDNNGVRLILRVRRRDCVSSVELRRRPRTEDVLDANLSYNMLRIKLESLVRWFEHNDPVLDRPFFLKLFQGRITVLMFRSCPDYNFVSAQT